MSARNGDRPTPAWSAVYKNKFHIGRSRRSLCLKPDEQVPPFFLDLAYNLSCHWTISSSQIPSNEFENYGWGEVVPDGFGESLHDEDGLLMNGKESLI